MAEEDEPPSGRFSSETGRSASLKRWEGITDEQRSQFGAYLAHKRWNKLKKRIKRHHRNGGNDKPTKNGSRSSSNGGMQ